MPIRLWEYNDIPSIYILMSELNESLEEDQDVSIESIQKHFHEMEKTKDLYQNYVYENNKSIIGFISIVNYRSVYHKKGTALINELIIKKEYRNKGFGEQLVKYVIEKSKEQNMDEIEVGVMKENRKAIEFYKKNGLEDEYLILGMEF